MKVERETAGFALPFTAGVFLAVYSGYCLKLSLSPAPIAAFAATALSLAGLLHPERRKSTKQWILIALAALCAGLVCGFTSAHISAGAITSELEIWAEGWGMKMQEAIDRIPFEDKRCNAVAKALITGEKSDIPRDIVQTFRKSGASHILALSGLHLGIIYSIITRSLSILGNYQRLWIPRSLIIMTICGLYTLATGAGPSILRAFLFIALTEYGKLTHRNHTTGQILFAALIIQLTISPISVKSVGFQLSYAAIAGIAFILPWMKSLWPGNRYDDHFIARCTRGIWDTCAMAISCQITTGPLVWFYFGSLPEYFMLTNLTAVPLTGIIIPAIIVTLVLSAAGICPALLIQVTEGMMSGLLGLLENIAAI